MSLTVDMFEHCMQDHMLIFATLSRLFTTGRAVDRCRQASYAWREDSRSDVQMFHSAIGMEVDQI